MAFVVSGELTGVRTPSPFGGRVCMEIVMTDPLKGLPVEVVAADPAAGAVSMLFDEALYPLEAVYGASYIFIDRAYVLLDLPEPGRIRVTIAVKEGEATDGVLRALAGEFANELLSCAWRHRIGQENRATIEAVTMQAISGAMGPPSLDDLEKFDFTEEPFDDPLGIAVSWEEKYQAKKDAPAAEEAAGAVAEAGAAAAPPAAAAPDPKGKEPL